MLLTVVSRPLCRESWGFKIKYDGWRCLAQVKGGEVRLQSRGEADATAWWPEVTHALQDCEGTTYSTARHACSRTRPQ